MDVTKPYEFIGFGAMDVTKPYKITRFSAGGPLAATQPSDKFFSKPKFWGPNCVFPPRNPSIEVGGEAPHLK
jgi:hypothetical protein